MTRIARHTRLSGGRYRFFCELSGAAVHTTGPIHGSGDPLLLAWELDGKQHFNRCERCGRWISDVMYNADTGQCVGCSPWEEAPAFCSRCGAEAIPADVYCRTCGEKLQYREVAANG